MTLRLPRLTALAVTMVILFAGISHLLQPRYAELADLKKEGRPRDVLRAVKQMGTDSKTRLANWDAHRRE